MKVSEMKQSKYLKKEDVGTGQVLTIKNVSSQNVAKEDATPEYKFAVHFMEVEKPLILNAGNMDAIAEITGSDETDDWVGMQVELYEDKNVMWAGKRVGGIRIRQAKQ